MLQTLTGLTDPYPVTLAAVAAPLIVSPAAPATTRDSVLMTLQTPNVVVHVGTNDDVTEDDAPWVLLPGIPTPIPSRVGQLYGRAYHFANVADPGSADVLVWPVLVSDPLMRTLPALFSQAFRASGSCGAGEYDLDISGLVPGTSYSVELGNADMLRVPIGHRVIEGYTDLYARIGTSTAEWLSVSALYAGEAGRQSLQLEIEDMPASGPYTAQLLATISGEAVALATVRLRTK